MFAFSVAMVANIAFGAGFITYEWMTIYIIVGAVLGAWYGVSEGEDNGSC
jgi:hypothetical protein